jgi:general secretion pathway protein J
MVSVALMALILTCLGAVTGEWMPSWRRGFNHAQRLETLDVGLRRIVADLDAAEFITANKNTRMIAFIGDTKSVTLVRAAASPGVATRLEFVSFAVIRDDRGLALIRAHAPFKPLAPGKPLGEQVKFVDPVALVRAPYLVSFAYAGPDRVWRDSWRDSTVLPTAIRIQARDVETGAISTASTATHPPIDTPARCVGKKSISHCIAGDDAPDPSQNPDATPTPAPSAQKDEG